MSFWVDFLGLGQAEIGVIRPRSKKITNKNIFFFASTTDSLFSRREDLIKPINAYGCHHKYGSNHH